MAPFPAFRVSLYRFKATSWFMLTWLSFKGTKRVTFRDKDTTPCIARIRDSHNLIITLTSKSTLME